MDISVRPSYGCKAIVSERHGFHISSRFVYHTNKPSLPMSSIIFLSFPFILGVTDHVGSDHGEEILRRDLPGKGS